MFTDPTGYQFNRPVNIANVNYGGLYDSQQQKDFSGGAFLPNTFMASIISKLLRSGKGGFWSPETGISYFKEVPQSEGGKTNFNVNIVIDWERKATKKDSRWGATGPTNGDYTKAGDATIYINPIILNDPNKVVLTMAHELVHAYHITSGIFAEWLNQTQNFELSRVFSEYYARDFGSNIEIINNWDYGEFDRFYTTYDQLQSLGYDL